MQDRGAAASRQPIGPALMHKPVRPSAASNPGPLRFMSNRTSGPAATTGTPCHERRTQLLSQLDLSPIAIQQPKEGQRFEGRASLKVQLRQERPIIGLKSCGMSAPQPQADQSASGLTWSALEVNPEAATSGVGDKVVQIALGQLGPDWRTPTHRRHEAPPICRDALRDGRNDLLVGQPPIPCRSLGVILRATATPQGPAKGAPPAPMRDQSRCSPGSGGVWQSMQCATGPAR